MDLPDDVASPIPMKVGSLGGGIALVIVGWVLFTNTMFGWSLRWIGDWWPMGLVAVGVWLIAVDLKGKLPSFGSKSDDDRL
jgi:hypothetical protein